MKNPLRVTTVFLGAYAGLIAIQHGIFEILQGNTAPEALMFNAIGPPCQPEAVWHACFPAMTLIPNLFVTGMAAMLAGLGMIIWAAGFLGSRQGWFFLGALSVLLLLFGGGFVPVLIGMIATVTASRLNMPGGPEWHIASALWPWSLALMALWLPGSWLLGHFFSAPMLSASGLLFFIFDIGLPVLAALMAYAHQRIPR